MPKTRRTYTITMALSNGKAMSAFAEGLAIVREEAANQTWNAELKKAVRRLEYAAKGLKVRKK